MSLSLISHFSRLIRCLQIQLKYLVFLHNNQSQNMSFTLDIEPSSSESTMDDYTEDESSVNQIDEFSDSEEAEIDATNFIIPTQKCVIVPSTPVPSESAPLPLPNPVDLTTDLHAIAIKIKKREESSALTKSERKLIDESSRHERGYGASICRIENRFLL